MLLAVGLLLAAAPGCSLVYRTSVPGEGFVLHADRDEAWARRAAGEVETIYDAYARLFGVERDELGTTRICLDGQDDGVLDHTYSPSLLGYYVPLLNLIRIDTEPVWARGEEALRQVLLHEVAHHFLVTRFPGIARRCWLNEGLAGNLEVTRLGNGRAEYPLLHPVLVRLAQKAVRREDVHLSLGRLLDMGWSEFHQSEDKVAHYALSWSIVYHLLEHEVGPGPLGQRIARLWKLDRERILAAEPRWRRFLREFDLTAYFTELAARPGNRPLTSRWAIRQMGELCTLDDGRSLPVLVRLLRDREPARRKQAALAFLRVLDRNPHLHHARSGPARRGIRILKRRLLDTGQPPGVRAALIAELGNSPAGRASWVRVLVPLLEAGSGEVRASAARALARLGTKPTIVNPWFWRLAPAQHRRREVGEWKAWLRSRERRDI